MCNLIWLHYFFGWILNLKQPFTHTSDLKYFFRTSLAFSSRLWGICYDKDWCIKKDVFVSNFHWSFTSKVSSPTFGRILFYWNTQIWRMKIMSTGKFLRGTSSSMRSSRRPQESEFRKSLYTVAQPVTVFYLNVVFLVDRFSSHSLRRHALTPPRPSRDEC